MKLSAMVASILAAALVPVSVLAQPADAPASEASDGITEIVVTAQRTATSIQKTPISIQAYTAEDLEKRGVSDLQSLARTDSSVNINLSTGQPLIAIRGVASQDATEVGDPAVSVAADGIFNSRPAGVFAGFYDIERVEILRGPQGTLFGRNSTGGTINIITARPNDRNEAGLTGEVGNYNLYAVNGFGNMTLSEGLHGRASFSIRSRDGYRNNSPASKSGDDEDMKSVRVQLAYSPSESFSSWILAQYTQIGGLGPVSEIIPFRYGSASSSEPLHSVPPTLSDGKTFPIYAPYSKDLKQTDVRGGATVTLANGITLNYLGGYSSIRHVRQQAINPFAFGPTATPFIYHNRETPDTINHEVRIASAQDGAFRWQAGGYFFKESSTVLAYTQTNPGTSSAFTPIKFDYPVIKSNSKAVFAQASYNLTDALTLTGGVRQTWDNKRRDGTFSLLFIPLVIPQPASTKSDKLTWTAGLDYQLSADNLLYGKISTGYKVGGFNNATSDYGPESLKSYEVGTKNSFLDNHLQVNLSVFRMDYNDQQVTQFVTGAASTGSITVNAGESRITGAEFNLTAQSGELGRLDLSANLTHARFRTFLVSAGWDPSTNLNLAGNRLPMSPELSFSLNYERPIALQGGGTLTPSVGLKYQGDQYFASTNYADQMQKAYSYVDAALTFEPDSRRWNVQLYGKNLTDKKVFADASEFYTFNNYTFTYQPPRTYGLRFSAKFD